MQFVVVSYSLFLMMQKWQIGHQAHKFLGIKRGKNNMKRGKTQAKRGDN